MVLFCFRLRLSKHVKMLESKAVIFTLKFIEFVLCSLCLAFHIRGIHYTREPIPHDVLSCGIFVCFMFHSLIGCIGIILSVSVPLLLDTIVDSIASVLFLISSIILMVYVENDEHLMFLTDDEEVTHPFFILCRRQSVYALITSTLYAMHASLGWDMYFISERHDGDDADEATQPMQLHFLPFRFCVWLGNRTDNACIASLVKRIEITRTVPNASRVNPHPADDARIAAIVQRNISELSGLRMNTNNRFTRCTSEPDVSRVNPNVDRCVWTEAKIVNKTFGNSHRHDNDTYFLPHRPAEVEERERERARKKKCKFTFFRRKMESAGRSLVA